MHFPMFVLPIHKFLGLTELLPRPTGSRTKAAAAGSAVGGGAIARSGAEWARVY